MDNYNLRRFALSRFDLGYARRLVLEDLLQEYNHERKLQDHGEVHDLIGFVSLYITARCHLKCIHCHAREQFDGTSQDIPTETIVKIINKVSLITDRIQLTGGEILLRVDHKSCKMMFCFWSRK